MDFQLSHTPVRSHSSAYDCSSLRGPQEAPCIGVWRPVSQGQGRAHSPCRAQGYRILEVGKLSSPHTALGEALVSSHGQHCLDRSHSLKPQGSNWPHFQSSYQKAPSPEVLTPPLVSKSTQAAMAKYQTVYCLLTTETSFS